MPRANWSAAERRQAKLRAQEWKELRERYLYSQGHLASAMGICKRTVCAIELAEWIPTPSTLHKCQALKRRLEAAEHAAAERSGELELVRAAKHDRYAHVYAAQGD